MSSYARRTNLIEGIGNEVLVGLGAFLGILIPMIIFVNRRQQQFIHPDNEENVASVREHLSTETERENHAPLPRASQRNDGHLTCPICLGQVSFGLETNCGHVFCGHCMVTYWEHQTSFGAVKCPCCRTLVSLMLLNFTSLEHAAEQDETRRDIIEKVNVYNRRFSGRPRSVREYLQDLPTLLRHAFHEFFSVGGLMWMFRFRIGLLVLGALLYLISPFDILPESVFGILGFLDDIFITLLVAVYISIIYRQVVAARANQE